MLDILTHLLAAMCGAAVLFVFAVWVLPKKEAPKPQKDERLDKIRSFAINIRDEVQHLKPAKRVAGRIVELLDEE